MEDVNTVEDNASMTKTELIAFLNEETITDVVCASQAQGEFMDFCVEIRTQSGNAYCFMQTLRLRTEFNELEAQRITDGSVSHTLELGKEFDPTTYYLGLSAQDEAPEQNKEADQVKEVDA